jgi:hypothetical protein
MLTSRLFEIAPHLEDRTLEGTLGNIQSLRLQAVDKECLEMWSIFLENINKTIDSGKLSTS